VLRTAFDKLGGMTVTRRLRTPKRGERLPVVLNLDEAGRLVQAAESVRDRLLIGLLYGCGLKVGELCRLRWMDMVFFPLAVGFAGR